MREILDSARMTPGLGQDDAWTRPGSGFPLEFTPYWLRGGNDKMTEKIDQTRKSYL